MILKKCKGCEASFVREHTNQKFCTKECGQIYRNREFRKRYANDDAFRKRYLARNRKYHERLRKRKKKFKKDCLDALKKKMIDEGYDEKLFAEAYVMDGVALEKYRRGEINEI